jgi:excisionase family DNA binding protein
MNDDSIARPRRLAPFKEALVYGGFGHTKCYELIAAGKIRAYKMGQRTLIDLNSVDQYHQSLPRAISRSGLDNGQS